MEKTTDKVELVKLQGDQRQFGEKTQISPTQTGLQTC